MTEQGSTQTVDSGLLVLETGDTYTGRVSLGGDLKSGVYTLTVHARSSGGAVGMARWTSRSTRSDIIITSPLEGKSYKRA